MTLLQSDLVLASQVQCINLPLPPAYNRSVWVLPAQEEPLIH